MSNQQLPNKLSECIKVALHDLELCRKDSKYKIDFSTWHEPSTIHYDQFGDEKPVCAVCFAGSVMAQTLNVELNEEYRPDMFNEFDEFRLMALDDIREGDLIEALRYSMGMYDINNKYPNIHNIEVNQNNYDEFVKSMNVIITMLEQYDL